MGDPVLALMEQSTTQRFLRLCPDDTQCQFFGSMFDKPVEEKGNSESYAEGEQQSSFFTFNVKGIVRTGTVGGAACLVGAVRARPPSAAASTRLATLCSGMQMATLCSSMTAPFTTPAQRPMTSTQPSRTTLTLSEVPSTIAPAKAKSSCLLEACCDFHQTFCLLNHKREVPLLEKK